MATRTQEFVGKIPSSSGPIWTGRISNGASHSRDDAVNQEAL